MLVDVCFDSTSESMLKLAAREDYSLGEIAVFPDSVCFGAINTMTPKERKSELLRLGYSIDQDFEQRYKAFLTIVAQAEALRVWMLPYPYAALGLLYISSLVDPQTKLQGIKGIELVTPSILWLDDKHVNTAFLTELIDAGFDLDQKTCAQQWQKLVKENAPLRLAPNGVPISCNEDVLDEDIIAFCKAYDAANPYKSMSEEEKQYLLPNIAWRLMESLSQKTGGMLNPDFYQFRITKLMQKGIITFKV